MIAISEYAKGVQPSATLAAGAKARLLRGQGVEIFDFSLGEPDQPTPAHICAAAHRAMEAGHTHYTPAGGLPEVRAAIARWYERFYRWQVNADHVVICSGAKHAIHNALAATCGPGDEVIIPTPYWVSYGDLVAMAGAKPVLVTTSFESRFKMTAAQYRAARTPRTRLIMLNSPCNPTGMVYTRAELEQLADAILETDVGILSDEIYEQMCYGDAKPTCIATLRPGLPERTITISGASKSYAMTGWRMGWAIAPKPVVEAMGIIQSQETGCPNSVSQHALLAALEGPQECVAVMRREYDARRQLVCRALMAIPGIRMHEPDGTFYVFFDVSAYFNPSMPDSVTFCQVALDDAHVNLVPGSAFGAEGFVRMSFAASREQLEGGLAKLRQWLVR